MNQNREIFDWDKLGPSPEALKAFDAIQTELEFPNTYSGQAWRAAYRIWKVTKDNRSLLEPDEPYGTIKGVELDGLGLSGFMYGWAVNAVRQMFCMPAGGNGAIVTLGVGCEPAPVVGPAELEMREAIGGKEQ